MFNKIKDCLKNNKIFYLNIFLSALLICFICLCVNKYSVLYNHGYIYPWFDLGWRIASQTYESVINNFLPVLFNSNPNDFRSGFGFGSVILAVLYVFICLLFVKGFFLSDKKAQNPLLRKELCLIFPLAALLLYIPLYDCNDKYAIIFRFNDLATSAEYFFVLIPVLIAAFSFYDILMGRGKKENRRVLIFYALISYVAGYYNELANITLFSFGFFFLFFLFLFDRQKLFNKYSLFIIVPFLTGCINYYIFSGSALSNIAHYDSTLLDGVRNLQTNFVDIWHSFVYEIFVSKAAFYAGIIFLSLILYKLKTENYKNVLFFVWSLIFGYVLANLSTIFVCSLGSETEYLFERTFWDRLYVNILELACLILLGAIYKYEKIKGYVFAFITAFFVLFVYLFCQFNEERQNVLFNIKKVVYQLDKINLVYSLLGESAVIPAKYLSYECVKNSEIFMINSIFKRDERFAKDKYINAEYLHYVHYFSRIYELNYAGAIFKDDDFAEKELKIRLALFDEKTETEKELKNKSLSFKQMYKKYKGLKLTLQDIDVMEAKHGKLPVLDKARAFIFFNDGNYDSAMKLYKKYLISYSDDIDSLLHIACIYEKNNDYKKAEAIYEKLHKYDKRNLLFLHKLLCLYFYNMNDIEKAIEINQKIIEANNDLHIPYRNMAILYILKGDREKAKEYVNISIEKNPVASDSWLDDYNNKYMEKENINIEYPGF